VRTAADGTAGTPISTAVLAQAFGRLNVNGEASRSGYLYRVFLPAQGGIATTEATEGGDFSAAVDVDATETIWCLYAWPRNRAQTGIRTFFVNQRGDLTCADSGYSGTAAIAPANAGAAFVAPNPLDSILGDAAITDYGADGALWVMAR